MSLAKVWVRELKEHCAIVLIETKMTIGFKK